MLLSQLPKVIGSLEETEHWTTPSEGFQPKPRQTRHHQSKAKSEASSGFLTWDEIRPGHQRKGAVHEESVFGEERGGSPGELGGQILLVGEGPIPLQLEKETLFQH